MPDKAGIRPEQQTIAGINGSGKKSLIDKDMFPVVRQGEIESKEISNDKCYKHHGDVRDEYHPSRHRMPVEEGKCLSSKG